MSKSEQPRGQAKQRKNEPPPPEKVAADTARYEALAREHGADLSEEGFNQILQNVAKPAAQSG